MINDNNFLTTKDGQFTLSYELLCLLRWLTENDAEKLNKMVIKALANGLKDELQKIDIVEPISEINFDAQDIQNTMVDFFNILESFLIEGVSKQLVQAAREKKLMPTIEHIDTSVCDDETLRFSIEKATRKLEQEPNNNPKEQLFKELLKRWKPHNKNMFN